MCARKSGRCACKNDFSDGKTVVRTRSQGVMPAKIKFAPAEMILSTAHLIPCNRKNEICGFIGMTKPQK